MDVADLPAALPARTPLAGLDLGSRTIGVAVSDTSLMIASPLALIKREKFTRDAARLFELMDGRGAAGLVIGLPVQPWTGPKDRVANRSAPSPAT